MGSQKGFTVVELVVVIVLLVIAGLFGLYQYNELKSVSRDDQRKSSINTIHYSLEEIYFKKNKSYPVKLEPSLLPSVDAGLFNDPGGRGINETRSDYSYEPADCIAAKCTSYRLYADLEKEARFIKQSDN